MRPRTLTALAAVGLAVAIPVALTEAAPQPGAAEHAAKKKLSVAFFLDGPGISLAPVEGQEGTYTVTQRLWSKKQNVQWFRAGSRPAIGSIRVTKFAALLAKQAKTGGATAPVAHLSYVQDGTTTHFLATVSFAASGLGTRKAANGLGTTKTPTFRATLSPMSPERLQALVGGKGVFSEIAAQCQAVDASPGPQGDWTNRAFGCIDDAPHQSGLESCTYSTDVNDDKANCRMTIETNVASDVWCGGPSDPYSVQWDCSVMVLAPYFINRPHKPKTN